jgi:hypothetical protein
MLYREIDLLVSKLMSEMHTRIFLEVWMRLIVNKCLAEESGGRSYFTRLDAEVKKQPKLLAEYIKYVTDRSGVYDVVVSGEIGDRYAELQCAGEIPDNINLFLLPGGLREDPTKLASKGHCCEFSQGKEFIFLDDSYYSGKTLNAVTDYMRCVGEGVKHAYVFYDGSPVRNKDVSSLYRYYDFYGGNHV